MTRKWMFLIRNRIVFVCCPKDLSMQKADIVIHQSHDFFSFHQYEEIQPTVNKKKIACYLKLKKESYFPRIIDQLVMFVEFSRQTKEN